MTKDQFKELWRHEFAGMVLDATSLRGHAEQSIFLRSLFAKIDRHLGAIYDQLAAKPVPVQNGQPQQARKP